MATDTDILTVRETAVLLDVSPSTVRRWARSQGLPMHPKAAPGGTVLVGLRTEIEAWERFKRAALPRPGRPRKRA